jgi:hypothetical protein
MAREFGKPIHQLPLIPATVPKKTSRPRATRYVVPVRRAFEIKYSESMRDPRLPKSAQMRQAEAAARARVGAARPAGRRRVEFQPPAML